ncbi:MAG: methyltransferase domain-containing protein [Oscillospiraceae bacterium]|nr:methyltransferase domain-containing protein [Oscillospiraceae bacterium]
MELICPVCGEKLNKADRTYICPTRHSFDMARQGYVNLLTVQQKHSLNPGDTREQVLSRRSFLEAGYYRPILNTLIETAKEFGIHGPILDVGCGEGYYAAQLAAALNADLAGFDISKEAVRCAAAKYKGPTWFTATAAHIPVSDGSAELLTSLFALTLPAEFARVLKDGGYYFQVLACQDHLLGLKSIIYPELKLKEKDSVPELPGFHLEKSIPIRFTFTVAGEQIQNLFSMTPHVFRIGKEGAQRLKNTKILTDTASCVLNVYRKQA